MFHLIQCSLLVLILLIPNPACSESFVPEGWKYFREIHLKRTTEAGLVGIALESRVIENSRSDLADVRIVSSTGEVVPTISVDSFHNTEPILSPVPIYKLVKRPGKWTDLWIDKKNKTLSCGVVLQTGSKDFVRKVEIRGSDTGVEEYVIRMDGLVFNIPGPIPIQSLELLHPINNFRYIHLRFLDGEQPPLQLDAAFCIQPMSTIPSIPVDLRLLENRITSDNSTVLLVDFGEKRFPIGRINFVSLSKDFIKKVRLFKKELESDENPSRPFYEGAIFRIQRSGTAKANLECRFEPQICRYLVVELSGPGPAVSVKSLKAFSAAKLVVFEALPNLAYRLFYGNTQAKASVFHPSAQSFSLSQVLATASQTSLGEEQKYITPVHTSSPIPRQKAQPAANVGWKIAGISMLLIGLILLFIGMLKARSQRRFEQRRNPRYLDPRVR